MPDILPCVEIHPPGEAQSSVIWLHGLGADGHDFEPIVPYLGIAPDRRVRFIFPHAPSRCVTINMGLIMPAWFDIRELGTADGYDLEDVKESDGQLKALIRRENERGVPCDRIVLAGFSQGGAIALHTALRYPERFAGILALSTYLLMPETLEEEASAANKGTPIFYAHGLHDPLIPIALAERSKEHLVESGYSVEWHHYPMAHEVHPSEIHDVGVWLSTRLP